MRNVSSHDLVRHERAQLQSWRTAPWQRHWTDRLSFYYTTTLEDQRAVSVSLIGGGVRPPFSPLALVLVRRCLAGWWRVGQLRAVRLADWMGLLASFTHGESTLRREWRRTCSSAVWLQPSEREMLSIRCDIPAKFCMKCRLQLIHWFESSLVCRIGLA